jgi:ABC-type antimicrobial peptide transport system permease subunit
VAVALTHPAFNTLIGKSLEVPYGNIYFWLSVLLFILFTGIVAGSYPAFFLSSFKPIEILKGTFKRTSATVSPRKVLVVVQFSFAIVLIISTLIIVQQIRYAQNRETGYDRGQVVYHWITGNLEKNYNQIKSELLNAPMVIEGAQSYFNVIHVKLSAGKGTDESTKGIEAIFRRYNPDYPFEYHFVDVDYALKFEDTQRIATLTGLFAGLTIFISCLGLFGLAAYMAENRVKEIGVRKVLGASVMSIATLLSREFMILVAISIFIAIPFAWYTMELWLNDFSYRISMQWWVFALAGLLAITVSLLTVSYQAIRAALLDPTKSLRSE